MRTYRISEIPSIDATQSHNIHRGKARKWLVDPDGRRNRRGNERENIRHGGLKNKKERIERRSGIEMIRSK